MFKAHDTTIQVLHPSFRYQKNLVPECVTEMTDVQSYWCEISLASNLDGELGSCAMGLSYTYSKSSQKSTLNVSLILANANNPKND